MIGPVQSRCHEGSPVGKRNLRWEGFVDALPTVPRRQPKKNCTLVHKEKIEAGKQEQ